MEIARISGKGQMTIPKRIRLAARLDEGDLVSLALQGEHIVLRKISAAKDAYLTGVQEILSEWNSAEDDDAWRDL